MNGFDRIIGYSEIKEELCQIADILKNKERYDKLGVTFPAGLLLYGEPGVGKTLMAKSLAEEAGRKIFFCRKDELNKDFINTLKKTFSKAKENAPSVIILDDMDKFAKNSIYTTDSEEYSTIQALIDDVKDSSVFVIATANKRYCFPQSLLRAGRFDRIIEVEPPVGKDAENIVAYYIRDKAFEEDIDAQVISRIMSGKSCAALETVINEAGIFAGYKNSDVITMEHFFEACLKTVFNAPSESYSFYDDESDGNRLAKADASLKNLNDASLLEKKKFLTAADIRKICKKRESKPLSKSAPGRRRIKQAG